jgi:hypothetical protein
MPRPRKNPVAKTPEPYVFEPQDVSEVGPTPHEYLFAELADSDPELYKEIIAKRDRDV